MDEPAAMAACVAEVVGVAASEVPREAELLRPWLAERGLGLVPVADASSFSWAGPWIARRPALDGGGPRAVLMFGVPSGVIADPAGTADEVLDGVVIAPLDIAAWPPTRSAAGDGVFDSGRPGSALTLVDAAVLEALGRDVDHRRNVVVRGTDLNQLIGREFTIGAVRCRGRRLCEPCAHLDRLNGGGILRPLVHRGGLRADILTPGTLRVGDRLSPDAGRPPTSHERQAGQPWDASYRDGPAPWDIGGPQPAIVRLAAEGAFSGPVLDAGCGSGENALHLAALGLRVFGFDVAETALAMAREKAAARGLDAEFAVADALHLDGLGRTFETVLDCGLFHTFDPAERRDYVAGLASVTRRGGHVYVLCFSDADPHVPHPITEEELRAAFAPGWRVVSLGRDRLQTRFAPDGAPAWLAELERLG